MGHVIISRPRNTTPTRNSIARFCADFVYPFRASGLLAQRIVFFRRLALLLRAGMPLHQALGSLAESARDREWKTLLKRSLNEVADGGFLSDAFAAQPLLVSEAEVALIRAAEVTGSLSEMTDRI